MNTLPKAERLRIGVFGTANAGKSTFVNTLTRQQISIVSDVKGTTTDPVEKAVELPSIGACVIIDTAGYGDNGGHLSNMREERTERALSSTDIAIVIVSGSKEDNDFVKRLKRMKKKALYVVNAYNDVEKAKEFLTKNALEYSVIDAANYKDVVSLFPKIASLIPEDFNASAIISHLVREGDIVMLVMPQDKEAPKKRLILPESSTIRELIDRRCITVAVNVDSVKDALKLVTPSLVVVDSQVMKTVSDIIPKDVRLTSFSALFARYKGDIDEFVKGAKAMDMLSENSHILIAEACSHSPLEEDIGTVKIPKLLRKRYGEGIDIDFASGVDFPKDIESYDLIIHCGACMFNRRFVLSRQERAKDAGVPMTNYGIAIAYLSGILDKIVY